MLETLASQQDRLDEFVNVGLNMNSFTSTPTQMVPPTGVLPDPGVFWQGLEREEDKPETEPATPSHYSSNPWRSPCLTHLKKASAPPGIVDVKIRNVKTSITPIK